MSTETVEVWHGGTYVSLGFAFGGKLKGGYPLVTPLVTINFIRQSVSEFCLL